MTDFQNEVLSRADSESENVAEAKFETTWAEYVKKMPPPAIGRGRLQRVHIMSNEDIDASVWISLRSKAVS